ncbi:hypothetical protein CLF_102246, partial [Clonorchis sinensis]
MDARKSFVGRRELALSRMWCRMQVLSADVDNPYAYLRIDQWMFHIEFLQSNAIILPHEDAEILLLDFEFQTRRFRWLLCYPVSPFVDVHMIFELGIPCRRTLLGFANLDKSSRTKDLSVNNLKPDQYGSHVPYCRWLHLTLHRIDTIPNHEVQLGDMTGIRIVRLTEKHSGIGKGFKLKVASKLTWHGPRVPSVDHLNHFWMRSLAVEETSNTQRRLCAYHKSIDYWHLARTFKRAEAISYQETTGRYDLKRNVAACIANCENLITQCLPTRVECISNKACNSVNADQQPRAEELVELTSKQPYEFYATLRMSSQMKHDVAHDMQFIHLKETIINEICCCIKLNPLSKLSSYANACIVGLVSIFSSNHRLIAGTTTDEHLGVPTRVFGGVRSPSYSHRRTFPVRARSRHETKGVSQFFKGTFTKPHVLAHFAVSSNAFLGELSSYVRITILTRYCAGNQTQSAKDITPTATLDTSLKTPSFVCGTPNDGTTIVQMPVKEIQTHPPRPIRLYPPDTKFGFNIARYSFVTVSATLQSILVAKFRSLAIRSPKVNWHASRCI